MRFLAFGDMGTGDEAQARVAAGMQSVCTDAGCDFVIGLGDNIYEAGVTSPYDPQFMLKFEHPYAGFSIPFHMTLGNHDNWATGAEVVCATDGAVDVMVTGHDHDLQYLPAQEGCGTVEFVVSGAAAQVRDIAGQANPTLYACGSTLGFVWMEARGEVLTTRFHDADGVLLAERLLDRADPTRSSFVEHARPASCTPS